MTSRAVSTPRPVTVAGATVAPGARQRVELPVAQLSTGSWLTLPMEVVNGTHGGPTVWLSGAIHGDEPIGVEIIRQVIDLVQPENLAGTVIAVPIVNVFGFIAESRYLPDRRDLNRTFPGTKRGSLAAQLADLFMREVVARSDWGIDLHCGSNDRINLPQVRADLHDEETRACAVAFAAPVAIHSKPPRGSLRNAACARGAKVLVYEGGEARRFEEGAVTAGVDGIMRALAHLGVSRDDATFPPREVLVSVKTHWARATKGGILRPGVRLGDRVKKGARIAVVTGPLGVERGRLKSRWPGLVIGLRLNPIVYRGDAVAHVAEISETVGV